MREELGLHQNDHLRWPDVPAYEYSVVEGDPDLGRVPNGELSGRLRDAPPAGPSTPARQSARKKTYITPSKPLETMGDLGRVLIGPDQRGVDPTTPTLRRSARLKSAPPAQTPEATVPAAAKSATPGPAHAIERSPGQQAKVVYRYPRIGPNDRSVSPTHLQSWRGWDAYLREHGIKEDPRNVKAAVEAARESARRSRSDRYHSRVDEDVRAASLARWEERKARRTGRTPGSEHDSGDGE
jgi:hypothetical protein